MPSVHERRVATWHDEHLRCIHCDNATTGFGPRFAIHHEPWCPVQEADDLSGVVVVDARHATGSAGRVLRAYQRAKDGGGVLDSTEMRHRLASTIPIDSLRAADQAFVRVADREWITVKDRWGKLPETIGPEEMSEILARQRRVELGMSPAEEWRVVEVPQTRSWDGTVKVDPNAPGREWIEKLLAGGTTWDEIKWPYAGEVLKHMLATGSTVPDGSDITLQFGDVFDSGHSEGLTFHSIGPMWQDDIDRNVRMHMKRQRHAGNQPYVDAELAKLRLLADDHLLRLDQAQPHHPGIQAVLKERGLK